MWVDKRERMPAPEDCDEQGCILVWHIYQGANVMNLHNLEKYGGFISHWMRTPAPPAN